MKDYTSKVYRQLRATELEDEGDVVVVTKDTEIAGPATNWKGAHGLQNPCESRLAVDAQQKPCTLIQLTTRSHIEQM